MIWVMSGVFLFGSCVLLCPPMCPDCSPPSLIFNLTSMERDVRDYVANCSISARSQSNSQQPSGLLKPLVTPHRPKLLWTSLPGYPSPLHNRPVLKVRSFCCSSEITHCYQNHPTAHWSCFRLHGIPLKIVLDRGPQFTSQVWKIFTAVGANISLSSRFHLRTDGLTKRLNQELELALFYYDTKLSHLVLRVPMSRVQNNSLTLSATVSHLSTYP